MAYTGGSEAGAHAAEAQLSSLAKAAGICFRFDQRTDWQPVESQRALLWAARQGKAEPFMDRLNQRHFEHGQACAPTLPPPRAAARAAAQSVPPRRRPLAH